MKKELEKVTRSGTTRFRGEGIRVEESQCSWQPQVDVLEGQSASLEEERPETSGWTRTDVRNDSADVPSHSWLDVAQIRPVRVPRR